MKWTKEPAEAWSLKATLFTALVKPTRDGRWTWEVFKEGGSANAAATGVSQSMNAAKRTVENFVTRSGGE